jgi:Zn-finger nucleic acid-binding protein
MITCPRCAIELQESERADQPVGVCPRCGGLRMTAESLGAVVDDWEAGGPADVAGLQMPLAEVRDGLPCPACRVPMETFNYAGDSGVFLHRCGRCEGVWLDGGQLELVGRWATASRTGLERDRKRFSGDLHREEVRQDALEQNDIRTSPAPAGSAMASPFIDGRER